MWMQHIVTLYTYICIACVVTLYSQLCLHQSGIFPSGFLTKPAYAVEPGYNDIGLCVLSSVASDILWYNLIPHC